MSESLLALLKSNPLSLFQMALWLARGRAHLKQEVARRVDLDTTTMPLNTEVRRSLNGEHQSGRRMLLVSGTDQKFCASNGGAGEFVRGSFRQRWKDECLRAGEGHGIARPFWKRRLRLRGQRARDLPVWAQARRAIVVSNSRALARKAEALCEVEGVFRSPAIDPGVWFKALRIHQWAKNLLIFVPLLGAHQWHKRRETQRDDTGLFRLQRMCVERVSPERSPRSRGRSQHPPRNPSDRWRAGRCLCIWGWPAHFCCSPSAC